MVAWVGSVIVLAVALVVMVVVLLALFCPGIFRAWEERRDRS